MELYRTKKSYTVFASEMYLLVYWRYVSVVYEINSEGGHRYFPPIPLENRLHGISISLYSVFHVSRIISIIQLYVDVWHIKFWPWLYEYPSQQWVGAFGVLKTIIRDIWMIQFIGI